MPCVPQAWSRSFQAAATAEVAPIIKQLSSYRRWADFRLRRMLRESDESSRDHLRASLALLEVDATQADFLLRRLLAGSPEELPVIRDSLEPIARVESTQHNSGLTNKLWSVLESSHAVWSPSGLPFARRWRSMRSSRRPRC